ncbi:MAG: hypothetical protein ACR2JS_04980 [Candidatus Nanopelagicales bacterium]
MTGIRVHPTCDTNADVLVTELFQIIEQTIIGQPRSQQRRIGPSEIGVPCDRRIGYRLAGVDPVNDRGVAWKPYVGTSVHEQMADMMAKAEIARYSDAAATERWKVEERVSVGEIGETEISGSCDLVDVQHGAVWDWKFTTRNQIREHYRPHGPGDQYRIQAHLYGRGFARQGYDVRTVGVIFFTRDGEFTDRHVWHEPYDEQIAVDALTRASGIQSALDALGPDFTLPTLETADSHCRFCPWFRAGTSQIAQACPGHPQETAAPKSLAQLIGA